MLKKFFSKNKNKIAEPTDIKEELDMHLTSINQNSQEIEVLANMVAEMDAKLEKIIERMDELQMIYHNEEPENYEVELTHREQEAFLVIYAEQEITAQQIARKLGFTEEMVHRYVYNLISKGVPILKEYKEDRMTFRLERKFKDLQAKKNILKIDERISQQLLADKAL